MLERFFETKTACDVDGTMAYFAPEMAADIDATLGRDFDSYEALQAVFEQYMPSWAPPAGSYASKILAGDDSSLVLRSEIANGRGRGRRPAAFSAHDYRQGRRGRDR